MNEIIRSLIKWAEENGLFPVIYFRTFQGEVHCFLRLERYGKCVSHDFYIAGGRLALQNWDRFPMEGEVDAFIESAKRELLKQNDKEVSDGNS